MRQERTVQARLFDLFADHEIGRELKAMSQWLDEHRELIGLVEEDLRQAFRRPGEKACRPSCCALLKQHRQRRQPAEPQSILAAHRHRGADHVYFATLRRRRR